MARALIFPLETNQHGPAVGEFVGDRLPLAGDDVGAIEKFLEFDVHTGGRFGERWGKSIFFLAFRPIAHQDAWPMQIRIYEPKIASEVERLAAIEKRSAAKQVEILLAEAIAARSRQRRTQHPAAAPSR